MKQVLSVTMRLPGFNEMAKAKGSGKHAYNTMKRKIEADIVLMIKSQGIKPMKKAWFTFSWQETNKRRDPDNIVAAKKFILDALVDAGILPKDGWKEVMGLRDTWTQNKEMPGVVVTMTPWPERGTN